MAELINTKKAPEAVGPYSQAVKAGDFLFISGQLPLDPATGTMVDRDIKLQTRQSLENIQAIVAVADMNFGHIVKMSVFLANMDDFALMNEVYASYFPQDFPARIAVQAARLPKDALVEIEAIAYKKS